MKQIAWLITFALFAITAFSQKNEKYYYDKDWKGCPESKSEYYRIFTLDSLDRPSGTIYDYYRTGELMAETDGAVKIDMDDDSQSVMTGMSIGYYRSGNRKFTLLRDFQGSTVSHKTWYENGNLQKELTYKNGKPDGNCNIYYENGKLFKRINYIYGKTADKFYIECDEFGDCKNTFYEDFASSDNDNQWLEVNDQDFTMVIIPKRGLFMKNKTSYGSKNTINLPLDLTKNFSIETIVSFQNGELNKGHGLICGFKDGDNYMYFLINANGQYSIGAKAEGINFSIKEWTHSKALNKQRNGLKLMKIGDKVYFLINGQVVHNSKFNGFKGNYMGYYALGKKEVLFENLIVKQDLSIKGASDDGKTASSSERKVNGSGFFIDHRGYIATNYHVVKDAIEIVVYVNHKGQQNVYEAEIVQNDMQNDLSILRINDNSFKPFTSIPYNFQTGHSAVGTSIFALGYPLANVMGHEIKFTDGKISAKSGLKGDVRVYQISVPIQSGNSGGALFDYNGNLIGVTSSSLNREYYDSENVNYAIKSSYLKNLIDVLPVTIRLPNDKTIATKQLTEKISILSDYVVLIHVE